MINKVVEGVDRLFLSLSSLFLLIMTLLPSPLMRSGDTCFISRFLACWK